MTFSSPTAAIQERIDRFERSILLNWTPNSQAVTSATLEERMRFHMVPGASVAVINEGEVEWARGFGLKEAGQPEPVPLQTYFQAGSISKPVTAMAALRLVQEGRLDLDENVNAVPCFVEGALEWRLAAESDAPAIAQPLGGDDCARVRRVLAPRAGSHARPDTEREPPSNSPSVVVDAIPGT